MGTFDTTGRPLKLTYLNGSNSSPRAANAKNGMLYITYNYFVDGAFEDVLIIADSTLNPLFINQYNISGYRIANGLGVSDNGSIYVGGNTYDQYDNGDAYIEKYNSDGQLGTCNYTPLQLSVVNIDPQTTTNDFTPLQREFQPITIPVTFVPDIYGQSIGSILCSSAPQCHSIKISGTNAVCRLNEDYPFFGTTNAGCTLQPLWLYDTAYTSLHNTVADTAQLQFKRTGNTYIIARINAGCKYYDDSAQVQIQSAPSAFTLGNDTLFCPGDSIVLNAGNGFNSYQWQDGSKDSVFTAKKASEYYVKVDNVCNDVYRDTVHISSALLPSLSIGNDTTICKGDTMHLSASSGFAKYNWLPQSLITTQAQQTSIAPLQNTVVSLIAITSDGCIGKDSLKLTVITARPINLGNDTSFCADNSLNLSVGTGYRQYIWNNGSITSTITAKQSGSYWIHAEDVNGCFANDTLVVQALFPQPVINLGSDQDLCLGAVKLLNAGAYSSYQWQDGTNSQYYSVSQPGKYWVYVTDQNGCAGSDTFSVQKLLPLPVDFLKETDCICEYEKITIQPTGNFTSYQWSTGSLEPVITVNKAGIYSLQVQNVSGCKGSDTIQIVQKQCLDGVFIPNAFTPNGDGINDIFRAKVYGITLSFQLQIFNRFGELIFTTSDPYKGWDGTFKSVPEDVGAFVYQCSYQLVGGKRTFGKGTFVLIK